MKRFALFACLILGGSAFAPPFTVTHHSRKHASTNIPRANQGTRLYYQTSTKTKIFDQSKRDASLVAEQDEMLASSLQTEQADALGASDTSSEEYRKGFLIIAFITFLNASLAPVWHHVFAGNGPPPLFLNAVVSMIALMGLLAGGPLLDRNVDSMANLASSNEEKWSRKSFRGGMELGFWKALGTTCHIYGMALTTANHGAFLIQLTTLIVPVLQSLRGEKIPNQMKLAVVLALGGIAAFTQDHASGDIATSVAVDASQIQLGDALCVGAAIFYSLYDIQTFYWGREIPRTELVTIKIGFQAVLSCILCAAINGAEVQQYIASGPDYGIVIPTILWSGLIVNALATFLQVGGMQAVGPTRAQTIFASQPLWAGILNFIFLGEIVGAQGFLGGGAFLGALYLAATAKPAEASETVTE